MASLMRTSNPALNAKTFERQVALGGEAMTVQGTVNKTGVLLLCVVATAAWTWSQFPQGGFFDVHMPYIHQSGGIGIAFSCFVVIIAALNLVLDFDFVETGAREGAPKYMEWYAAFGLMVTLIWLYLEILRLLSKLRSRR